ncbi:MAG: ClpXP protease specificity-enhancing factor SspB [Pseudomonadota bacterium]
MSDSINYTELMHDAMRVLVMRLIDQVAQNGLPGEHHFYLNIDTHHDELEMADWLFESYPDEITIVIQHWFEKLEVHDTGFAITLNFGDKPEPLFIPWDAIKTFVDPSVEFGIRFETETEEMVEESGMVEIETEGESAEAPKAGEIVSLDSFRKD